MNANEFRVGNWVEANSPMMQVKEITEHTVGLYMPGSEADPFLYDIEEIRPIKLSPEILEKCGFENQRYEEWEAFAYKDTAICASWDGVEWVFKYGYDSDLSIASCEFLHQLQNLIYALTGEELTYKQ